MHIAEGILSPSALGVGMAVSAVGVWAGLRKTDHERLVPAAVLAAFFFVGSLVHVPLGPGSVHLVLNGLLGFFLGWTVFPALLVAMLLQAVLFRHGGLSVLGVNVSIMAIPALACHYVFRSLIRWEGGFRFFAAFTCGALSVAGAGLLVALVLWLDNPDFRVVAGIILLAHLPVMALEGCITMLVAVFIARARPELFWFGSRVSKSGKFP